MGPGWGSAPPPPPPGQGGQPPYGGPPGGYGGTPPSGPSGYSVGNAFSYAFDKFKANLGPLILITVLLLVAAFVVQFVGNIVSSSLGSASQLTVDPTTGELNGLSGGLFGAAMIVSLLFSAISFAVQLVVQAGLIKAALGVTRGESVDLGRSFNGINWAQVLIAALLTGLGTFIGLVLCILPGIVFIFLTSFTLYFVIDRNMDAVPAIKASINLVKDNVGALVLFFLASIAAYIIGICLCGVGLLAAIPIVVLAQAYTFRVLTGDTVAA